MAKAKKDTEGPQASAGAQGTVGEGRFYRPPSVAPDDDKAPEPTGPEGRFYQPSGQSAATVEVVGDPAAQTLTEDPIGQASTMAGEPPTKEDVKAAKDEAKAVEAGTTEPTDPAAETVQPDPIAAAGELAQGPPVEQPAGNATREEWAEYGRSQGAVDADLVDADGKELGRDALRTKYGTPPA